MFSDPSRTRAARSSIFTHDTWTVGTSFFVFSLFFFLFFFFFFFFPFFFSFSFFFLFFFFSGRDPLSVARYGSFEKSADGLNLDTAKRLKQRKGEK